MGRLILNRLAASAFSLAFVVVTIFAITAALPGDVADTLLGQSATREATAALRHAMGLDQPAWVRFGRWVWGMLHADPGRSLMTGRPVAELVGPRLYNSLLLAAATAAVSVPVSLVLGLACTMARGTLFDRVVTLLMLGTVSVPVFLIATVAVFVFAVQFHVAPALADINAVHSPLQFIRVFLMPVVALAGATTAQMSRMIRACLIDVFSAPWIEMAVLKGVAPVRIVLFHALPNAIGSVVNAIALSLSSLLGGVVVVETVFNYPGMAGLMVDSVAARDVPVVQCCALIFCVAYLSLTTLADIVAAASTMRGRAH
ncbi:dipeptide/oligopeptide/nickel ABC transporter permease [Acidomonas methanolica]|uniref:ABC transporter oligopeptide permease OppB n=1 Tax=Acidomonas methanolica NBRC 104435 TaxID=1231351 RepID=A0A023D0E1_ACIMT|nr:peptide/nickel transport system permease protein [Acidomonas methanolica]GAJ27602.1 ABC transporter oligopeptide permease OppB [Acidomonas methanolica NBRC 104435]GBQ51087.1 dipeptide/oligopeptide/nickel ABC transporter permease [Acidomonas methanolica]GEK98806.1 ABC transporter permease [Acidomonas methanolica NBRC 104435]